MDLKLINSSSVDHPGYGAGSGTIDRYEYECPCGKGKLIDERDNIPGFREHDYFIDCPDCREKYDYSNGKLTLKEK